ncbi:MAG: hypothetical protein K5879_01430 [Lachnospiraceae bacterium]|nr:hypothetical protein [Lachnospiraceae bacterium]
MNENKSKMAVIGFILGIFGAVTSLCMAAGCPFAAAAIIVSGIAKKHDPDNKQAKLGQILGIVGVVISFIIAAIVIGVAVANGG